VIILGLSPAAQVIILQGLATYAAISSAYFFARPILRGEYLEDHRVILSEIKTADRDIAALIDHASGILTQRAQADRPRAHRDNWRGVWLLVASFIIYSGAVGLQIETDSAFAHIEKAPTAIPPKMPKHQLP
jgi:hypothetical protein